MSRLLHFITHPEVDVDPAVAVTEWGLSAAGLRRLEGLLREPWLAEVRTVFTSAERKAWETGSRVAESTGGNLVVEPELGENDRSSTGYLPPAEFESVADEFFASPRQSVRGWETAVAAQERILGAVLRCSASVPVGDVVVVSHGAVGTLLWCQLMGSPIDRSCDQAGQGSFYTVDLSNMRPLTSWRRIPVVDV